MANLALRGDEGTFADSAYSDALTVKDFQFISNSGDWIDRAKHVEMMRQPLVSGSLSYDDVRVRLFGSVDVHDRTYHRAQGTRVAGQFVSSEARPT